MMMITYFEILHFMLIAFVAFWAGRAIRINQEQRERIYRYEYAASVDDSIDVEDATDT